MKCGIVGLPNVGKSTLFNALTASTDAQAANFPFCTIDPNVGCVDVPDERLKILAQIASSATLLPSQVHFVDIAGLVKGASQGQGLGNQFLSHIREVDAILHVVRCFTDPDVIHVDGKVFPLDDVEILETELVLADLQSVEKRLEKKSKKADPEMTAALEKAYSVLQKGEFASTAPWQDSERALFPQLGLLTLKPLFYLCNIGEEDLTSVLFPFQIELEAMAKAKNRPILFLCSQLESEISVLSPEDKVLFLQPLGLKESGLDRLARMVYEHMGLMTFFTIGPKEARGWTLKKGSTAFDAAGCIHTDFQKGFIKAETISYQDYVTYGGPAEAKVQGKVRFEGKEYVVQDGDVLLFRHSS
jgi:hypothetical protein